MRDFDSQLLRFKQSVHVTADQDAAHLLELSKAAFSDRKKRDSFPSDKLYALAARRPDLKIDVDYVLTGKGRPLGLDGRLQAISSATEKVSQLDLPQDVALALHQLLIFVEIHDSAGAERSIQELSRVSATAWPKTV